jgi:hypothetical protein
MTTETNELKSFWDYANEPAEYTGPRLAPEVGTQPYHLRVVSSEAGAWDNGQPRLDINCEVACGGSPLEGRRVRIKTISLGAFEGKRRDGTDFTITYEASADRMSKIIGAINGDRKLQLSDPYDFESVMNDAAPQLIDAEFVGTVGRASNPDFDEIKRCYSFKAPPKLRGKPWQCDCSLSRFQ